MARMTLGIGRRPSATSSGAARSSPNGSIEKQTLEQATFSAWSFGHEDVAPERVHPTSRDVEDFALPRSYLQEGLARIVARSGRTVLLLSDRVLVMSARPGRVLAEHPVDVPRPRALADMSRAGRVQEPKAYVARFADRLRELFPGCPPDDAEAIARHACAKYSGRVGRSRAAKAFEPDAIRLAVRAHLRHRYTPYDELLAAGREPSEARPLVRDQIEAMLARWEAGTAG